MNPVQKGRVVSHDSGKRIKQIGRPHHHVHRMIDIPNKDHPGRRLDFVPAPSKGARGHVVLHDLHAIVVLELDAGHFVKGHDVPHAD